MIRKQVILDDELSKLVCILRYSWNNNVLTIIYYIQMAIIKKTLLSWQEDILVVNSGMSKNCFVTSIALFKYTIFLEQN